MIATVTMNPCIDTMMTIPGFVYGGMNRVQTRRSDHRGKGINVSIVLRQLGYASRTLGMNYTENGLRFSDELSQLGISYECVWEEGSVRENFKLLDLEKQIITEVNQKGSPVTPKTLAMFDGLYSDLMDDPEVDTVVVTGSVPPGVPQDYYRKLVELGNRAGKKMILDAEGPLLQEGLKAKPYLIKPNLFEFETAFGLPSRSNEDIIETARNVISGGTEIVCLSMGADGTMIISADEAWYCAPVPMEVKSATGAGDSVVAGMCIAMQRELPLSEVLRYGVCAANGSLIREGTLLCTKEDFRHFEEIVTVERID